MLGTGSRHLCLRQLHACKQAMSAAYCCQAPVLSCYGVVYSCSWRTCMPAACGLVGKHMKTWLWCQLISATKGIHHGCRCGSTAACYEVIKANPDKQCKVLHHNSPPAPSQTASEASKPCTASLANLSAYSVQDPAQAQGSVPGSHSSPPPQRCTVLAGATQLLHPPAPLTSAAETTTTPAHSLVPP